MSQELLYTSAPRGLKSGTHGFCMVLCSEGMPAPLATALEGLSAYKPVYPVGDPAQDRNPVTAMHVILPAIGRKQHVLSRVASYGLDYSGRPNKLAHHVVLEARDLSPAGPAWMLTQPGVMKKDWSGDPKVAAANRRLPTGDVPPSPCRAWARATGDAGWAGVLAESLMKDPTRQAYLIIDPGFDPLPLFAEAIALLPADRRWQATFSTYYTTLPAGATCNWRCLLADSPLVHQSKRHVHALRLDLTGPLGKAPDGEWVEFARTGKLPRSEESKRPAISDIVSRPTHPQVDRDAYQLDLSLRDEPTAPLKRRRRSRRRGGKRSILLLCGGIIAATGIAAVSLLSSSAKDKKLPSEAVAASEKIAEEKGESVGPPPIPTDVEDAKAGLAVGKITPGAGNNPATQKASPEPPVETVAEERPPESEKHKPTATTTWFAIELAGSDQSQRFPVPMAAADVKELQFFVPEALAKKLAKQQSRKSHTQLDVSFADKLDPDAGVPFCSIVFVDERSVQLTLKNESYRPMLDGCVISLTAQNQDSWQAVLWGKRDAPVVDASRKEILRRGFTANDSVIRQQLPLSSSFLQASPLIASSFRLGIGRLEVHFEPVLRQAHADGGMQLPNLTPENDSLSFRPEGFAKALSDLRFDEAQAIGALPVLTLVLTQPTDQLKPNNGSIELIWEVPQDLGDFLKILNQRLNVDLKPLRRHSIAITDAKGTALPPIVLTPIKLPETIAANDLPTMQESLTASLKHVTDRLNEIQNVQPKPTAEAVVEHESELIDLKKRIETYVEKCDAAIELRDNTLTAKVIGGQVSFTAVDSEKLESKVLIPIFGTQNSN
ncbi:MAG TPA: hypothetical protein VM510_10975 [Caulifigura sp.]|jgi:hypothetical protein|nr:hypothetical protein [Caulifigura sp.]